MLRRADPKNSDPKTLHSLKYINHKCNICQRNLSKRRLFLVSFLSEEIVFNLTVSLEIMYLKVIHIVDEDTRFNSAAILEDDTTETVWNYFLIDWVLTYVFYPPNFKSDKRPQFLKKS